MSKFFSLYPLVRSILFLFSAETAHHLAMGTLSFLVRVPFIPMILRRLFAHNCNMLPVEIFGLKFKNPVGLAAGFDKDGRYIKALACLGFGCIEVGTVTPRAQEGNPKPRLFRLPRSRALINRMGFNNQGCDKLVTRLNRLGNRDFILGANIGKNKITPNSEAVNDYLYSFRALHDLVDYFVVNVSSPNTPGLRELQDKEPLTKLLSAIQSENQKRAIPKPVLLKIAPDLNSEQVGEIVEIVEMTGIAGIVATNTTLSRAGISEDTDRVDEIGAGGLSGRPVTSLSTAVIRLIHDMSDGKVPVIGVGGVFNASDAVQKMEAGASLIQVYTGFIYEGPGIVQKILRGMQKLNGGRAENG